MSRYEVRDTPSILNERKRSTTTLVRSTSIEYKQLKLFGYDRGNRGEAMTPVGPLKIELPQPPSGTSETGNSSLSSYCNREFIVTVPPM